MDVPCQVGSPGMLRHVFSYHMICTSAQHLIYLIASVLPLLVCILGASSRVLQLAHGNCSVQIANAEPARKTSNAICMMKSLTYHYAGHDRQASRHAHCASYTFAHDSDVHAGSWAGALRAQRWAKYLAQCMTWTSAYSRSSTPVLRYDVIGPVHDSSNTRQVCNF